MDAGDSCAREAALMRCVACMIWVPHPLRTQRVGAVCWGLFGMAIPQPLHGIAATTLRVEATHRFVAFVRGFGCKGWGTRFSAEVLCQ